MQTFVPYPDIEASAQVLDNKRLNAQINESRQLINTIIAVQKDPTYRGWSKHPACLMWKRYLPGLRHYHNMMLTEWWSRGYPRLPARITYRPSLCSTEMPWWWEGPIHLSHQANLVRKLPEHYGPLFPGVDPTMPYVWPGEHPNLEE